MSEITNHGNACFIVNTSKPTIPFAVMQYQSFFETYVHQPSSIYVKEKENSKRISFENIITIGSFMPESTECVWQIYCNERDDIHDQDIVVRKVTWHRGEDVKKIKNLSVDENINFSYPNINSITVFLKNDSVGDIAENLLKLDEILNNGIIFPKPKKLSLSEQRYYMEIRRKYDSSVIEFGWENDRHFEQLELRRDGLINSLDIVFNSEHEKIYQIEYDSLFSNDVIKKAIYGEK